MKRNVVRRLQRPKSGFFNAIRESVPFWSLVTLILASLFLGGSSREDAGHILLLRPIAIVALAIGLANLDQQTIRRHRLVLGFGAAVLGLVVIQLVPLPPFIWQALPGRSPMVEAAKLVGEADSWRPLSMVPWRTVNSLFALSVPLATLVLMCVLDVAERNKLFPVVIVAVSISALFGLLQALGPEVASLRLYAIYSKGVSTGLFANRNHQAVFLACLIVMVVAYGEYFVSDRIALPARRLVVGAITMLLIFLILMTGSRTGSAVMLLALLACPAVVRSTLPSRQATGVLDRIRSGWREAMGVAVIAGTALFFLFSRSALIERFVETGGGEEARFQIWGPIATMAERYLPVGTGFGTFPDIYKFDEPVEFITSNYMNHAHNDWLELPMEGGVPALALLSFAGVGYIRRFRAVFSRPRAERILARCGLISIALLAGASITDYPIRTPAIACFLVITSVWTLTADQFTRPTRKRRR